MDNQISFKSVGELSGYSFVIPEYQRGYRWTKEEVEKLLDDLAEFSKGNDEYYCLQPLVVCADGNGGWSVIDGQQRLTTIYLLIKYLKKSFPVDQEFPKDFKFSIDYITRHNSREFLENIYSNTDENLGYIDFYHMKNAADSISTFFANRKIRVAKFVERLIWDVRFIWYDATNECSEKGYAQRLFVRLNVGKIPLTNSELIKALFLNSIYNQVSKAIGIDKDNLSKKEFNLVCDSISNQISYRIASEWDRIEVKLNDPSFWSFIYGKNDGYYATRIEFLFDLEKGKDRRNNDEDKFFTFDRYIKEFEADNNQAGGNPDNIFVIKKWKEITDRFNRMQGWYDDKELYHYIGFLRFRKKDIKEIDNAFNSATCRNDFLLKLKTMVAKEGAKLSLFDGLDFSTNKEEIKAALLLFNVLSMLRTKNNEERLSFKDYYSQAFDIEHIKPRTPKELDSSHEKRNFLESNLEYLTGERIEEGKDEKKRMRDFLNKVNDYVNQNQDNMSNKCIQELSGLYAAFIKGENIELDKLSKDTMKKLGLDGKSGPDEMGNYVLLDASTNRKYKNASFIVKRFFIYDREMNDGIYILPCTKNVFNKMYSKNADEPFKWSEKDMDDYENKMKAFFESLCIECGLSVIDDENTDGGEKA